MSFMTPNPPKPTPVGPNKQQYDAMMAQKNYLDNKPAIDKQNAQNAVDAEIEADRKVSRGAAADLLSGGQGLLDNTPSATKTLLGY